MGSMTTHTPRVIGGPSQEITSQLCIVCEQLGTRNARWYLSTKQKTELGLAICIHHTDLHSLNASALNGCSLCQFILSGFASSKGMNDYILDDIEIWFREGMTVGEKMSRLHKDGHLLPQAIASLAARPDTLKDDEVQHALVRLSIMCGVRGVLLIGTAWANVLPFALRAFSMSPSAIYSIDKAGTLSPSTRTTFDIGPPFALATGLDYPLEPLVTPCTVSPTLFTDSLLRRIRGWRNKCWSHHSKCREMRGPQPLPSRVIETVADNAPHMIRLRDSRGESGTYAALSYCWGTCPQRQTIKSTLKEHLEGIRVSELPATIRDAIILCRSLEIPYLWVDSLCIIQDDPKEWHREASAMASIYGRSALTITTPQNSQSYQSFNTFTTTQTESPSLAELLGEHSQDEKKVTGPTIARPKPLLSGSDTPFTYSIGKADSPWMARGWTLQEWLLSPRILHCGSERVWDCYQTWYTESCLTALNDADSVGNSLTSHIFARMARLDPEIRETGLDTHWARLVEDFTSRNLSHEMDKMPAIAGLATKFMEHSHTTATVPGLRYLAGLWGYKGRYHFGDHTYPTSLIPLGLLWRRSGSDFMRSPAAYRAPSWSWAALDGPVNLFRLEWPLALIFGEIDRFREVKVMEVNTSRCLTDPPDSCSLVQTGWIIATTPLKRAYINPFWKVTQFHAGLQSEYNGTFVGLGTHRSREETPWFGIFDQSPDQTGIHYVDESLYLLHVATAIRNSDDLQAPDVIHHALIAERIGNLNDIDCFRRLGIAWYSPSREKEAVDQIDKSAYDWNDRHMLKEWQTCKVRLI